MTNTKASVLQWTFLSAFTALLSLSLSASLSVQKVHSVCKLKSLLIPVCVAQMEMGVKLYYIFSNDLIGCLFNLMSITQLTI